MNNLRAQGSISSGKLVAQEWWTKQSFKLQVYFDKICASDIF